MKKIKAVIFDLDGTVADTLPLCMEAFRESIEPHMGRPVSDEEIIATFGPSEEGTIKALIPDRYDRGVSDYLRWYQELHDKYPEPFGGIAELLDELKRKEVRIAMVTGKGRRSADITLKRYGIGDFFETVETGDPSGGRKPEGIRAALGFFGGLSPDEAIYVGDSPGDIVDGEKAGVPVVAAAWASTARPEKLAALNPHKLFGTIDEFKGWLLSNI